MSAKRSIASAECIQDDLVFEQQAFADAPLDGFHGPTPRLGRLAPWPWPYEKCFLIAGPCSAESETQMLVTARSLARQGVSMFRAGVWKARTRGGCFEGIGAQGLEWLKSAALATGLPVTTEVATPQHVEAALAWDIDCLWIGARTTSNPFSMQELAEALRGVDIPLMVKNPIGADLGLWIGALERLYSAGAIRFAAIHRGFKQLHNHGYRNQPCWAIPLKLKELVPELPIFCDPSHISGRIGLIKGVSQKALRLGFNGLFIESHCQPHMALTDANQQLHPKKLESVLETLAHPPKIAPIPNHPVQQPADS